MNLAFRSLYLGLLFFASFLFASPSQVHLECGCDLFSYQDLKRKIWEHRSVIEEVLKEERALSGDYYVFYHAASKVYLYQELVKALIKEAKGGEREDFCWLRLPRARFASNVKELIQNEGGEIDDSKKSVREQLLSVNLSLFGNDESKNNCTLAFWLLNHSVHPKHSQVELFKEVLQFFDFEKMDTKKLIQLAKEIEDQTLMQIFVPKSKKRELNEVFYFAHDLGKICTHLQGKEPTEVLDAFLSGSKSLPHIKALQGRLLLNSSLLLNKNSGVKIKRYFLNFSEGDRKSISNELLEWIKESEGKKKVPLNRI